MKEKSNRNNIFRLSVLLSGLSCISILLKLLSVPDNIADFVLLIFYCLGIIITFVLIYRLTGKHAEVMGDNRSVLEEIWDFIKKIPSFILVLIGKIKSFFKHLFHDDETDKKKGEMSAKFFVENDLQSYVDKLFSFILVLTSVIIKDIEKINYLLIFIFFVFCLSYFIENYLMRKISAKGYHISSKDYCKIAQVFNFLTLGIISYFFLLLRYYSKLDCFFILFESFGIIYIVISFICLLCMCKKAAPEEPKDQSKSAAPEEPQGSIRISRPRRAHSPIGIKRFKRIQGPIRISRHRKSSKPSRIEKSSKL